MITFKEITESIKYAGFTVRPYALLKGGQCLGVESYLPPLNLALEVVVVALCDCNGSFGSISRVQGLAEALKNANTDADFGRPKVIYWEHLTWGFDFNPPE
jgi:hypothetical protein